MKKDGYWTPTPAELAQAKRLNKLRGRSKNQKSEKKKK